MIVDLINRQGDGSHTAHDATAAKASWNEAEAWTRTSPASLSDPEAGRVLLACRDRANQKWGPRWLSLAGLQVVPAFTGDAALASLSQDAPSLVIAEVSLADERGRNLFELLLRESAKTGVPVLAMCANGRESRRALELGATDVARRPFEWQLLSRRAAWLARSFQTAAGLDRALAARHFGGVLAVLVVGLDRFGAVNETVGRDGGDALLAAVAERLDACLGQAELGSTRGSSMVSATVARFSGDRFGLMVNGLHSEGGVRRVLEAAGN